MDANNLDLGNRIRILRERRLYSQEKLAELVGISRNEMSNIERNETIPKLPILIKIAEFFNVSIDYLATGRTIGNNNSYIYDRMSMLDDIDTEHILEYIELYLRTKNERKEKELVLLAK